MNKRQKKKLLAKEIKETGIDPSVCQYCGKKLDLKNNAYAKKWGTCDTTCYMHLVGMSWGDFM